MIKNNRAVLDAEFYIKLFLFCAIFGLIIYWIEKEQIANSEGDIFKVIEDASQSVVGISVIKLPSENQPLYELKDGILQENAFTPTESSATGLIYSTDGYIITNSHVIENAQLISATLPGGEKFNAEIIGYDTLTDLALLKIEVDNLHASNIGNSDNLMIGEWVVALGNPLGLFDLSNQSTATRGIISGLNIDFGVQNHEYIYTDMIQTDASINNGNSGGPLINMRGEVIGINTFIMTGGSNTQGSIGIGFSIPINRVTNIIHELLIYGKVQRTYTLGFKVKPMNLNRQKYLNAPSLNGVNVIDVENKSSAMKAGLQVGDIILRVDDINVKSYLDIIQVNRQNLRKVGDYILLDIWRNDTISTISVELKNYDNLLY